MMKRLFWVAVPVLLLATPTLAETPVAPAPVKAERTFEYLDRADFEPIRLLPAPPARGSVLEKIELDRIHALIANATPERLAQAKWDAQHENAGIFNEATGRDLARLPQTWALLDLVRREASVAASFSKSYFGRYRPYGVDQTLHDCEGKPNPDPMHGYPSGHSVLGYATGFILARLIPDRAPAILARAADYALSREYCGSHFSSDTAASHVIGTLVAEHLLADPRLATRIAAARAELLKP